MLKKLLIKNFQAHKHLQINLSPTITTIVGRSDVGKSAIYRAIRWIATGLPKGNDFIRWGEKTTSVILKVDNHKVIRRKGSSNIYELDGNQYKALRTDIPEDIKKTLNLAPINFQSQFDSPFWFAESAGEISRQLNAIVDLSLIDTSIKKAISKTRENKSLISVLETQVEDAKKDVERFGLVVPLQELLGRLEVTVKAEEDIASERDNLQILFEQAIRKRRAIKTLQPVVEGAHPLNTAWQKAQGLKEQVENLGSLITHSEKYEKVIRVTVPSTETLTTAVAKVIDLDGKVSDLTELVNAGISRKEKYDAWTGTLFSLEKQLVTEFKGRCPLCGNPA